MLSVVDPDPDPQGSETFCRIRILDPDPVKDPKLDFNINKISKKVGHLIP
jgi:hypothetical protein